MGNRINFNGMILEEISLGEFEREDNTFKLIRWKGKERPFEWFFKLIKPVKSFKEKFK